MNTDVLSSIYYLSITALVIFSVLLYLLKRFFNVNLWPVWEKPGALLPVTIFGTLWWVVIFGLAVYLSLLKPVSLFFEDLLWKIAGVLLFLAGLTIGLWAMKVFQTAKRVFGGKIDTLITQGCYKYTRHPQYFSLMLITVALAIVFNTLQLVLLAITSTASAYIAALMEEMELEKIFGQSYTEYKKKTPFMVWRLR